MTTMSDLFMEAEPQIKPDAPAEEPGGPYTKPDSTTGDSPTVPTPEDNPGEPDREITNPPSPHDGISSGQLAAMGVQVIKSVARPQRTARLDALYKGKKFIIVDEIHMPDGEVFKTPLGHTGRHGWLYQEVGNKMNVGVAGLHLLRIMHDTYGAIELPAPKPRGRPKKTVEPEELMAQV